MAQTFLIGREAALRRWRSFYQEFKKKSATPVLFVRVLGPAGVGRTALVDLLKKDLDKGDLLLEFSCREGPLPGGWLSKLKKLGNKRRAGILLRDLHELEESEKGALEEFIACISAMEQPILIVLESQDHRLDLKIPSRRIKSLELKPFTAKDVGIWLKRFAKIRKLSPKAQKKFYQKTRGLPREMLLWAHYLQENISNFSDPGSLKDWPSDRGELLAKIVNKLKPEEAALLRVWGVHPSWLNRAALSAVAGQSPARVGGLLKKFSDRGWIEPSITSPPRYFLKKPVLGELSLQGLSPTESKKLHQCLFSFIESQNDWPFRETWLAYHANGADLSSRAFCWNILAGESYEQRGQWETAQAYYGYGLKLARDDFQRSYLKGIIGETYLQQKQFPQAWSSLKEAETLAEKIPWSEFQQNFNLSLGRLLSLLGRYAQGEEYYRKALKVTGERGLEEEGARVRFQLGICYLEQASYGEAETIFLELDDYYQKAGDVLGRMGTYLSLLQIHIALNRVRAAYALMEQSRQVLGELPAPLWEPLFQLLVAKLHTTQGRLDSALRILEEAAQGFEANGDLPGKVEVLLAMSAPMLEYGLIAEAQRIMDLLGKSADLGGSPALQHSIQLRRMAVSAFSGKWVEEDFALAGRSELQAGRTEDWLLFWFHLALAARNYPDPKFFNYFIGKARELATRISGQLEKSSAESFLQRPDVARIFRLSEEGRVASAAVSARRETGAVGPAEAATLAPPVRGPSKSP